MSDLIDIERALLDRYGSRTAADQTAVLFLLAAPRCGSTLLYQLLVDAFELFYFLNFVNDQFAEFPVVGAAIANAAAPDPPVADFRSRYGKTAGPFGPSEASQIFRHWFGGEHPSQLRSARILAGKEDHLRRTISGVSAMTGKAIVAKNAWNCFRIQELSRIFPACHFIWLRRDIRRSAISDLHARYQRGGPLVWNSATPANVDEIKSRPYWEQVVEQQYEYNRTLAADLQQYAGGRFTTVWYEQVCDDPAAVLKRCAVDFSARGIPAPRRDRAAAQLGPSAGPELPAGDVEKIVRYTGENQDRLADFTWESRTRDGRGPAHCNHPV